MRPRMGTSRFSISRKDAGLSQGMNTAFGQRQVDRAARRRRDATQVRVAFVDLHAKATPGEQQRHAARRPGRRLQSLAGSVPDDTLMLATRPFQDAYEMKYVLEAVVQRDGGGTMTSGSRQSTMTPCSGKVSTQPVSSRGA